MRQLFAEDPLGSVSVYELYLIHMSVVPLDFAVGQGNALVHQLRTNSEG